MPDEEFRPGAHDLETPFLFVPHGAPDPVEFKRKYPGWVSFPATFVPHPRPIPKWAIINGQRWPLDKKGRPWPKTRYGRPTCPFDELPPGFPAPGTQYELLRKLENPMLFFGDEPMPTVEEFSLLAARLRAERAAAAPPPPIEPPRAYDGDGLGPARDYLNAMRVVNQQLREFAAGARQREAARLAEVAEVDRAEPSDLNSVVFKQAAMAAPTALEHVPSYAAEAEADLLTPVQSRRGGGRPTQLPGGGQQTLTLPQEILMFRFNRALGTLRRLEPNNREATFVVAPNTVPSEAWITRLESEARQAEGRAQLGQPPRTLGMQQPAPQVAPPSRRMQALDDAIQGAINSNDSDVQLEGQTARLLQEAGVPVVSFRRKIVLPHERGGEIDVETSGSIVEVTTAPAGKLSQVTRYLTEAALNPKNKQVILFAPNYGGRATRDVQALGIHVARTPQELIDLIRKFGG